MRIISRINNNVLNSTDTASLQTLDQLFSKAPNVAAKTIRLFPQFSISMLTEGIGQIYGVNEKSDKFEAVNDYKYKWKLRGNNFPKPKIVTSVAGSNIGLNGQSFTMIFDMPFYTPNDIFRLSDGTQLFVDSEGVYTGENSYSYLVSINGKNPAATVSSTLMTAGTETGYLYNAFPELSERGYTKAMANAEEHINYLTRLRHSFSWSGDAASTKYVVEDVVNYKGELVKQKYITDQLWLEALETYHYTKEFLLVYGRSTVAPNGKCYKQDKFGRDIIIGDGLIEQMAPSTRQTYNALTIELIEDILVDMALRMPKKTGNEILVTTGLHGYKEFGRLMRNELKFFTASPSNYITTRNGKIAIGGEFNSWEFQGNRLIVAVNNVFDNPNTPSDLDADGNRLESSRMLFVDMSSYDGVRNIHLVAKNGRSFISGELDGLGGQDGMTSGKISTSVDGSSKHILGQIGLILHNPYSSFQLEKKVAQ